MYRIGTIHIEHERLQNVLLPEHREKEELQESNEWFWKLFHIGQREFDVSQATGLFVHVYHEEFEVSGTKKGRFVVYERYLKLRMTNS